jgi:sulfonate transport system permease protein
MVSFPGILYSKHLSVLLRFAGVAGVIILWAIASRLALVPHQLLPPPLVVCHTFGTMVLSGQLFINELISVRRVLFGFAIGASAGLLLGGLIASSPILDDYLGSSFLILTQIPIVGWLPFFMMVFGLGESLKLVIVALAALIPVVVNTRDGMSSVPKSYVEIGEVYQFTAMQRFRHIALPAALPSILTGLRYGLTHAWIALVVVELFASTEGLGYLMVWGRQLFEIDLVICMIVVIGVTGYVMDQAMALCERRVLRNHPGFAK